MNFTSGLEEFLRNNRISQEDWTASQSSWGEFREIAAHHEANQSDLGAVAELYATLIQKIPEVHSVRWRVKNTDHLLEKIVRKRLEGSSKYIDLNPQNYNQTITDLIGLRALHLFKEDYIPIDACLRRRWEPLETPIIFVREGDDRHRIDENLFEVKQHPAGYRSVHYVLPNHTLNQQGSLEVQVRTIFEEGWSEIDHKVRYPNFSDNEVIKYFLSIFNRLAGNADEMGGFVTLLSTTMSQFEQKIKDANQEKNDSLTKIDSLIKQIGTLKSKDETSKSAIEGLKNEVAHLRTTNGLQDLIQFNERLKQGLGGLDMPLVKIGDALRNTHIGSTLGASDIARVGIGSALRKAEE